jgi:signal transduction histidine kinase
LRNHVLDLNIQEKISVKMEEEKIYSVITNLLLNAAKYTPKGGIITVKSEINDHTVAIKVKDNGIGLTKQEQKELFKAFGKIERFGFGWDILTDGMGMGLFIAKGIIDSHGGDIWVESKGRNEGSTFIFTLPLEKK